MSFPMCWCLLPQFYNGCSPINDKDKCALVSDQSEYGKSGQSFWEVTIFLQSLVVFVVFFFYCWSRGFTFIFLDAQYQLGWSWFCHGTIREKLSGFNGVLSFFKIFPVRFNKIFTVRFKICKGFLFKRFLLTRNSTQN